MILSFVLLKRVIFGFHTTAKIINLSKVLAVLRLFYTISKNYAKSVQQIANSDCDKRKLIIKGNIL